MPNLTTIAKWAESLGISRQQGYAAIERCEIPVEDGKVDTEYATMLYRRHTRPRAGIKTGNMSASSAAQGDGDTAGAAHGYESSRARREAAEAAIAEMKQAEMSGLYLVKDAVDAAVFEIARALRDGMTNCSRRIAADVAGLSSADECEEVIDREHRLLLETMAHAFAAQVKIHVEVDAE
ncbi:hypothetical protein ASC94_09160 [Massilia sp. Root418]|uniref:hypothetical protein n=1 Tax=Massilia sp. Root418 TaxID=1736532 RepID=UPI0006F48763|nr:hypothetical protein [Massilia sp. Root418]KQW96965.1 hypothetical protein ASC94_09160 [Massilia sp. Root418]